ncbi:MAG: hypothetical protein KTR16_16535 [Acidiferrobacterales bacterium]|nr:hypothetical protein [Acidiferrobacterales bacterium]
MTPISAEQINDAVVNKDWPLFESVQFDTQDATEQKHTAVCQLRVTSELSYLAGHFPEQPVVPGVVQVHWVGELAKKVFACEGFSELKKVKFSNPILPDAQLALSLSFQKSKNQVNFVYSDDQQTYSSGVMVFQ